MGYYKMGVNSDKFLGTHSKQKNYDGKQGYLLLKKKILGADQTQTQIYILSQEMMREKEEV